MKIETRENRRQSLYKIAFALAIFTILYNIAEGLISIYFGYQDDSLVLLGFGIDSSIEIISGLGIAHMIFRIWQARYNGQSAFERTALQVTGFSFFTLTLILIISSIIDIWSGSQPETTFWGIVISIISIITMWILMFAKTKVGMELNSDAILEDAKCTNICIQMSVILLLSSGIYELTNFVYADSIGALVLSYFSFKEGKDCFEKGNTTDCP